MTFEKALKLQTERDDRLEQELYLKDNGWTKIPCQNDKCKPGAVLDKGCWFCEGEGFAWLKPQDKE